MKDTSHQTIANLIAYIYCGEVNVKIENIGEFVATAKALQIMGLDVDTNSSDSRTNQSTTSSERHQRKRFQSAKSNEPQQKKPMLRSSNNH